MSKPIAIFYHCLFYFGDPPELQQRALDIVTEQMDAVTKSGLMEVAAELHVGINGSNESIDLARTVFPLESTRVFHGLDCRNECLTIVMMEEWLKTHPGWYVLYFHAKGCTHGPGDPLNVLGTNWRHCLMRGVVDNWKQCVADLDYGYDSVGSHWMPGMCDGTQNIWAGNFWWATSNFLRTCPSIYLRDRISVSGIKSVESRYEAEVWLGNAPVLPKVKDYHPVLFNVHVSE
jgi:hypothetical protein